MYLFLENFPLIRLALFDTTDATSTRPDLCLFNEVKETKEMNKKRGGKLGVGGRETLHRGLRHIGEERRYLFLSARTLTQL